MAKVQDSIQNEVNQPETKPETYLSDPEPENKCCKDFLECSLFCTSILFVPFFIVGLILLLIGTSPKNSCTIYYCNDDLVLVEIHKETFLCKDSNDNLKIAESYFEHEKCDLYKNLGISFLSVSGFLLCVFTFFMKKYN